MLKRRAILMLWVVIVGWPGAGLAALIVDPPKPITHRVSVQIIETALSATGPAATIFGTAEQRAHIEAGIDSIWAQAGIDILFPPSIIRYNDEFAYQGTQSPRPVGDFEAIINNATSAGKVNTTPSVINMFFVKVVPGSPYTGEAVVSGIAGIGYDGIAQFVGTGLLALPGNRDKVASVVAHEIGHNLGLFHTAAGSANLMSSVNGSAQKLSAAQIGAIFQTTSRNDSVAFIPPGGTGFPQLLPILPGDYNRDGVVNAADYAVWRNSLGSTTSLAADGNGNNVIDSGDYTFWRSRYGTTNGTGQFVSSLVPEPASWVYLIAAIAVLAASSRVACSRGAVS